MAMELEEIKNLLPAKPPYLPLPRRLVDSIEPPTSGQLRYIALLCDKAHIKEPLEEQVKSKGEAGRLIRELQQEIKYARH